MPPPALAVAGQDAMDSELPVEAPTRARALACRHGRRGAAGRQSRRDGDAGPLTRGKGLTAIRVPVRNVGRERGPLSESGKRVTRRAARIRHGPGRAQVGEEARGACRDTEEGEQRALHRVTPAAVAREALRYLGLIRDRSAHTRRRTARRVSSP